MGIDGFLRQLKDVVQESHLRRYSGQTVVVDAFSWLHKACYGCAFELATGKETVGYVRYMLRKVDLLRACGIRDVILVFDGQRLPLKASTHEKRSESKQENHRLAIQHMIDSRGLQGDERQAEFSKAYQHFQKAVSITPEIVRTVILALKEANIKYAIAPFEADAQMVWMCKEGLATAIITEDSDVLVYCVAANVDCPILFKLDDGGIVQVLSRSIIHTKSADSNNPFVKKLHFLTAGDKESARMFVQFCALAGCDFIDSLPNMGIVTALKHIFSFRGAPGHVRVQRLLSKLTSAGTKVPPGFNLRFQQAESVFFHHVVFNPATGECEFLIDETHPNCHADIFQRVKDAFGRPEEPLGSLHNTPNGQSSCFLGQIPEREVMRSIYVGDRCSRTRRRMADAVSDGSPDTEATENPVPSIMPTAKAKAPTVRQRDCTQDPVTEERRKHQQAQQRDASMRSLLTTYTQPDSSTIQRNDDKLIVNSEPQSLDSKTASVVSMKVFAARHARDSSTRILNDIQCKRRAKAEPPSKRPKPSPGSLLHFFKKAS